MKDLPSAEYKIEFEDGTVSAISVHPNESLEDALGEMLTAAGASREEVASVRFLRTFDLAEEMQNPS